MTDAWVSRGLSRRQPPYADVNPGLGNAGIRASVTDAWRIREPRNGIVVCLNRAIEMEN